MKLLDLIFKGFMFIMVKLKIAVECHITTVNGKTNKTWCSRYHNNLFR
jgi:hypothetical protein